MQAWRNQNNEFAFDGGYVSINDSFTTLEIVDDFISHSCIEAQFDPSYTKLRLFSYDCPYVTSGVVCQMYQNQQVSCTSGGTSSSTGSPAGSSTSPGGSSGSSSGSLSGSSSLSSSSSSASSPSPSTSSSSSGNSQGSTTSSTTTQSSGSSSNYARNKRNDDFEGSGYEFHDPLDLMMNPDLQTEFKKSINLLRKTMKDAFAKVK